MLRAMARSDDNTRDFVAGYVVQVLRTSVMLQDLACSLIEDLPEDGYDGEENADVVIGMLAGTIRWIAQAAGEPLVRHATWLLGASRQKVIDDLKGALARGIAMDHGVGQG
jgi:hypothetical protein